ncbi:cytochrome P450 [Patellaria atrata CBS 101060]|uniref:Cytochrome P450 n=1 Tax=Patellaria atrata CBS 101060 TaxID=1346257 RepID=A0A9P4S370_9PEZI|nr:cytochrome P450 [Patellaria atrata CBS 101060]
MSSPVILVVFSILVVLYLGKSFIPWQKKLLDLPIMTLPEGSSDFRPVVKAGYEKYPDQPFQLQVQGRLLTLIPLKFINEIKSLPEWQLSSKQEIRNLFQGRYTGIGHNSKTMVSTVKVDLTRYISKTLEALQDEMEFAADRNIGACEEWTPVYLYPALLRIVALISGRVFVGLPLNRNEDWIRISINFTIVSFMASQKFASIPAWKRPFVVPFSPETRAIKRHRAEAVRLLTPIIQRRVKDMKDPNFKRPDDMIQWALENATGTRESSVDRQADIQLTLSMAAIHTTSTTVCHCLYDLCAHPEYLEPLCEEIESVLAETGEKMTKVSMIKLRKLDSFIKESQRLSPPGLVAMRRLVMSHITLSDGTVLPKGTSIAVPSWGVTRDGTLWNDPETFDGFRFAKLRAVPGSENKHQFAMTGPDSLSFGHGVHACPGRFFAGNEIKILLSHILLHYHVKIESGLRPENRINGLGISTDPTGKVLFKKRERKV